MENVKITARDNGPLLITGKVEVLDGEGNLLEIKEKCFLCRCGLTKNAPFCDGSHKGVYESKVRSK
ncbi:MAG: Iron sulfur, CDGSH-type [Bacillales bacterium]|jgi:CDGSH-type Zn-finger protein|nr:Iron sulfur, CDGSH-type [Bacillales bacterium]